MVEALTIRSRGAIRRRTADDGGMRGPRARSGAATCLGAAARHAPNGLAAAVSGGYFRLYTLTYPAETLGAADGADRRIFLQADVGTLEDRFHRATKRRAVGAMIEAVAAASIVEP